MNDFVLGMIAGAFLFYIGLRIFLGIAMRQLQSRLEELAHTLEENQRNLIEAKVEEHNGTFYVYNTKDQSFIVQGTTMKEVREAIDAKFKGVSINITQGDKDVLARLLATNK